MIKLRRPLRVGLLVLLLAALAGFQLAGAQAAPLRGRVVVAHGATAAPRVAVRGERLVWSAARGVRAYIVSVHFPHRHFHRLVRRNAIRLPRARSALVRFRVRTARPDSAWSQVVTVDYGPAGEVMHGGHGGHGPGGGSSPSRNTSNESTETGGTGKGGGSGQKLKVGLIGGVVGWGAEASETIRDQTHVRFTRVAIGSEGWNQPKELVDEGITPLIVYNPGLYGMTPAAVAEGVASYIPHMKELGLTEIELGNEVYYHSSTPGEYAAQYAAAHEALAGTGIKLIADVWTDTYDSATEKWSQWESGGGWGVMFVQALGYVPDAWSFHAYGPMSAHGFGSGEYESGWGTVPRMIEYMKQDHIYAPFNITEVGQPVWEGADGNTPVTEAEQASDIRQYVEQSSEWGVNSIYIYEGIDTPEGGYGLYKWPLAARPSAAVFAEMVADYSEEPGSGASSQSLTETEGV